MTHERQSAIYIVTNKRNGTLYTGVTSNLPRRIWEHRNKSFKGFTYKYDCKHLVYYEIFENISNAIFREKRIKAESRKNKISLIEKLNPNWDDLFQNII